MEKINKKFYSLKRLICQILQPKIKRIDLKTIMTHPRVQKQIQNGLTQTHINRWKQYLQIKQIGLLLYLVTQLDQSEILGIKYGFFIQIKINLANQAKKRQILRLMNFNAWKIIFIIRVQFKIYFTFFLNQPYIRVKSTKNICSCIYQQIVKQQQQVYEGSNIY
ncbi:unnamed protein product [Paramecium sonneborni]|uniref:Uncharacterized protein n=1 Tax=Paramecium sonneborni TaxID=65129 RepID=A0A8S1K0Z5_9CILI|nr:unnamed protein product [Paramecium sonneborni]